MEKNYIKEFKLNDKSPKEQEKDLIESLLKTKETLKLAHKNFEYAEDSLIDYYSYKIKANQAKLDYLVKKARNRGMVVDMIKDITMKYSKAQ